jgi:hypothetical protein
MRPSTVTFARPFFLNKINRELPAGSYPIETDEEPMDSASSLVYRRSQIRLFVPRIEGKSDPEMWAITPQDFDNVIALDREPARPEATPAKPDTSSFEHRKAAFEKHRDDIAIARTRGGNAPLYGACLGILALLLATWIAHQVEPAIDKAAGVLSPVLG